MDIDEDMERYDKLKMSSRPILKFLSTKIVLYQGKFYESMVSGNKFDEGRYSACEDIGKMIRELMKE